MSDQTARYIVAGVLLVLGTSSNTKADDRGAFIVAAVIILLYALVVGR